MAVTSIRNPPAIALACVLLGLTLVSGCSKAATNGASSSSNATTSSASATSSSTMSSGSSSASASATATTKVKPTLGGHCEDLLPVTAIDTALGLPVIGTTSFIVGVPEPNIGRLVRLFCRYGISAPVKGKPAVAKVEITLSLYDTSAQANSRVSGTIEDYRSHGAVPRASAVGQFPATILTGYGNPTLVATAGPRSIAVTVDPKLVSSARDAGLVAIAKAAFDASAKYNQGGGPATSPSTTP